jgi:hypothetical protein
MPKTISLEQIDIPHSCSTSWDSMRGGEVVTISPV